MITHFQIFEYKFNLYFLDKAWRDCGLNGEWWDEEKNSSFSHYEQCPKDYHVMKWHFWV